MGMGKVKMGIIGCGYMGQLAHIANYAQIKECDLVAVADRRSELAHKVAQRYGIRKVYSSVEEIAADPEVEAVAAIMSWMGNGKVAKTLLEAGKHVFIEKPIAASLRQASEMVETAESNKVKLMVGLMKRYDAGVSYAKKVIDNWRASGEFGSLIFGRSLCFAGDWQCNIESPIITGEENPGVEIEDAGPEWLPADLKNEFHGFNNLFSHITNILRYLLGNDVAVEFVRFKPNSTTIVMDIGGISVVMEGGWMASRRWEEETNVYFRDGWLELLTPAPLLRNVPAEVRVYKAGRVQEIVTPVLEWSWAFKNQAEHFVRCILEDKEPLTSGRDSLKDMEIAEEIFQRRIGFKF